MVAPAPNTRARGAKSYRDKKESVRLLQVKNTQSVFLILKNAIPDEISRFPSRPKYEQPKIEHRLDLNSSLPPEHMKKFSSRI